MKTRLSLIALIIGLAMLWVSSAWAQPPTPQFAFTGFIQEATLDTTGAVCTPAPQFDAAGAAIDVSRLLGGTITVNGIKMIVPCNSIIQLPAATMTWADLFDPAFSAPIGSYIGAPNLVPANPLGVTDPITGITTPALPRKTGLALADNPMPFPSFEVSVNGNVVGKNADGTDKYIVGLIVPIEQQVLNGSSGIVTYIDYAFGSFRVGGNGAVGCDAALPGGGPTCTGTLVQFNDPVTGSPGGGGRWGSTHSIDPRFSGDSENVTIHTSTGFPLCIPRVAPPANDAACPLTQRPPNGDPRFPFDPFILAGQPLKIFDMPAPVPLTQVVPVDPACPVGGIDPITGLPCPTKIVYVIDPATQEPTNTVTPDAYKQIPLMVGDQVNYIGTIFKIDPLKTILAPDGVTLIPDNTAANTYVSAHTVEDVLGIFTAPGVAPAYVTIEAMLIGTNGAAVQGILQEASTRMTVVGFTSDPTRLVDIYAIDVHPCSGQETLRLLASEDPAVDAIRGRFVHRVLGGLFMPPTRMYVIKSRTQATDLNTGLPVPFIAANGIATGQFALPLFEYVFPENHRLGDPFIPNNYQDLPFLAFGSGPVNATGIPGAKIGDITSAKLGQLNPWPGAVAPTAPNCPAGGLHTPVVTVVPSTAISVATGATVTLNGAVGFDPGDDPLTRTAVWTPAGGVQGGTVAAPTYTFTAPSTPGVLTFTLTATDNVGSGSAVALVNVLQATDIVQIPAGLAVWTEQKGKRGGFGKLSVTATSSDPTATLSLFEDPNETFITGGPACPFLNPVDGGICEWGTASKTSPGVYDWVENKGAPYPFSLTVRSDKGGSATVVCGPATVKQTKLGAIRTVTCP